MPNRSEIIARFDRLTARVETLADQGFDRCYVDEEEETITLGCSQCEAMSINGVPCHERHCPNIVKEEQSFDDFDLTGDE